MTDVNVEDFTQSDTVEIKTSDKKGTKSFFALASILTRSSKFFRNTLNGNFVDAREKLIILHYPRPEIVQMYLRWLHGQNMGHDVDPVEQKTEAADDIQPQGLMQNRSVIEDYEMDPNSVPATTWFNLFQLAVLANQLQDSKFHNFIVDKIMQRQTDTPEPENMARYVYENTSRGNPLRKIMVRFAMVHYSGEAVDSRRYLSKSYDARHAPAGLWKAVLKGLAEEDRSHRLEGEVDMPPRQKLHRHDGKADRQACEHCRE